MKIKKKKILSIVMAGVMTLSMLVGCKDDKQSSSSGSSNNGEIIFPEYNTTGTIPVDNVKAYDPTILYPHRTYEIDSTKTFIKNNRSDYQILVPSNPHSKISAAAFTIKSYIKQATEVDLPIVEETENIEYNKVISVGPTNKLKAVNISTTAAELGDLGHKIESIDDNIYVCAYDPSGVSVAAYTLLEHLIGLKTYSGDEFVYQTKMTEIPFYKFQLVKKAVSSFVHVADNPKGVDASFGLGGNTFQSFTQADTGTLVDIWHNVFQLFPKDTYYETHPEFYIGRGTQISYVANGNQESYNLMVDIAARSIIESAKQDPNLSRVTITHADNTDTDTCEAAREIVERYGTESALQILFLNDVAKQVATWAKSPDGGNGRNIDIYFFAYQTSVSAPVSKVNGVYVPNEGIYMEENLGVVLAPIGSNWSLSIYDERNTELLTHFESWSAICSKLALWAYHFYHNTQTSMMPYDVLANLQSIYQAARQFNINWIYDQSRFRGGERSYFSYLWTYLSGQLLYNPDLDVQTETDLWFNYYFKDAQSYMKQYFDETRAWYQYLVEVKGVSTKISTVDIDKAGNWPYGLLTRWRSYISQAYTAIEKYKSQDEVLYNKLYNRINLESIMVRYMLAEYHASKFSDTELQKFRQEIVSDCGSLGINNEVERLKKLWSI